MQQCIKGSSTTTTSDDKTVTAHASKENRNVTRRSWLFAPIYMAEVMIYMHQGCREMTQGWDHSPWPQINPQKIYTSEPLWHLNRTQVFWMRMTPTIQRNTIPHKGPLIVLLVDGAYYTHGGPVVHIIGLWQTAARSTAVHAHHSNPQSCKGQIPTVPAVYDSLLGIHSQQEYWSSKAVWRWNPEYITTRKGQSYAGQLLSCTHSGAR